MLNEEMSKLRDHLSNTEKHLNDMRKALDREMNDKIEKRHAAERKAATDKQMAMVKQMHIDQLMTEIAEKNATLEKMGTLLDASAKSKKQEADKSVREVDLLRKQLREERKLKKSAIHKVDDLMSQISGVEEQRNQSKSQVTRLGILSEQRVRMLNEEMSKLRDHLSNTEKHLNDMRKALDREMNDKIEKRHAAERKAATDKQMAMVKQMHIDQLMTEIAEKNATLEKMGTLLDASAKSKKQEADKSVREVDLLRKQLREERKLKKSAIHKVDDLMSQ
ncbi:hypothetical protein AHF37_11586, partial [Paragonimus kellicotti]